MLILKKEKLMKEVSAETGLSRETLREQKNAALKGMKEALKEKKRGRKPKGHLSTMEEAEAEVARLKEELAEEKKTRKTLEKESLEVKEDLWMARHVIGYWQKLGRIDVKKKSALWKVLRNIFSRVPKKPYGPEGPSNAPQDSTE
jgi:hypothetical protein